MDGLSNLDVGDFVVIRLIENRGQDRVERDSPKGSRPNKLRGAACKRNLHVRPQMPQLARDIGGLISGNAARNAEKNSAALEGFIYQLRHRGKPSFPIQPIPYGPCRENTVPIIPYPLTPSFPNASFGNPQLTEIPVLD